MAKAAPDATLDQMLDYIATSTELYVCTSEPADRAAAIAASVIPAETMAPGDFSKAAGTSGARDLTIAAKNGMTADASGTANHVVLCTGSLLVYVTTNAAQAVTSGNTVNVGSWKVTQQAPA